VSPVFPKASVNPSPLRIDMLSLSVPIVQQTMIGFVNADAFQVEGGQFWINSTACCPLVPMIFLNVVRSIVSHDANCLVGCAIQEIWGNMGLQFV